MPPRPKKSPTSHRSSSRPKNPPPRDPTDDEAVALISERSRIDEWNEIQGGRGGGGDKQSRQQQQQRRSSPTNNGEVAGGKQQKTPPRSGQASKPGPTTNNKTKNNDDSNDRRTRNLERQKLQQQQQQQSKKPPMQKQQQQQPPKEKTPMGHLTVMGMDGSSVAGSTLTTPSALLHYDNSTLSTRESEGDLQEHAPLLSGITGRNNNNITNKHHSSSSSIKGGGKNDKNKGNKRVGFTSRNSKYNTSGKNNLSGSGNSTTYSRTSDGNDSASSYESSAFSHRKNGGKRVPWFASSRPTVNSSLRAPNHNAAGSSVGGTNGVPYRSATSTQRALDELKRKRSEHQEKQRAMAILVILFVLASTVHFVGQSRGGIYNMLFGGSGGSGGDGGMRGSRDKVYGETKDLGYGGERVGLTDTNNAALTIGKGESDASSPGGGEGSAEYGADGDEDYEYQLPPPTEKTYDPEHEFLAPLKHFADVSDPNRPSDTAFFFHVPRAGGSTLKDIIGKCLKLVQSSEVGVRDGHGTDPQLQVLDVQESKYVNVDTTTIPGIQRAVDLGLSSSGLANMIVSSYIHESAALFDLNHAGRAFILLRDPIERAMSMYWYRVNELGDLDASITIEDYAQGNGIENNWMCRFLANRMTGELTKEDLEQAKEILKEKFLVGFIDDLEESVYRIMKFNGWKFALDETEKMNEEDCINDLVSMGSNRNPNEYEIPKRGSQAHALVSWQTQFDMKLYAYAKEIFEKQTKEWGTKERKKELKKKKKAGGTR
ncbi:hypothetical protein ACHAXR_005912 [Thalassiosira sp. AJA248-18]